MKNINRTNILITSIITTVALTIMLSGTVYANDNCEENYGGGETCLINKRFKIEKWVRLEGDDTWKDEVTVDLTNKDQKDKYVEFKVKITNKSDKVENLTFNEMKMLDKLPDELKRIGGDGLTEYFGDFKPGESKTFTIKTDIKDDEKDKGGEFKKCAVNKASVYWKKEFEGSATATVCWKKYKKEIKELPETGSEAAIAGIAGLAMTYTGIVISKRTGTK